jgi:chromosomal replication initiator protein
VELNPRFRFENFVVGPSNRVAHAAAIAVSELPAKTYNPLFIHGQPGVGKTHLIHAMAHRIQASSRLRVGYISSVDLVQPDLPPQAGSADGFRSQCRSLDVLILDDIQFLSTKERGQLELFHAINEFLESQKQIIFASRSHPRDTAGIQERLASRLQWGLVACVEPPGFETRVSILLRKAHLRQREIPLEVAEFMANHLRDSVRELEGALLRVFSLAEFRGCSVDLEVARAALHDLLTEERHAGTVTIATILRIVQDYYGVKPKDFLSRSKVRSLTLARHVGMYLSRHLTQLSLQEIGMHFGGRDHTTVLYAEDRISRMRSTHPQISADLQVLKNRILSPPLY